MRQSQRQSWRTEKLRDWERRTDSRYVHTRESTVEGIQRRAHIPTKWVSGHICIHIHICTYRNHVMDTAEGPQPLEPSVSNRVRATPDKEQFDNHTHTHTCTTHTGALPAVCLSESPHTGMRMRQGVHFILSLSLARSLAPSFSLYLYMTGPLKRNAFVNFTNLFLALTLCWLCLYICIWIDR